jgi:hypothetical protein
LRPRAVFFAAAIGSSSLNDDDATPQGIRRFRDESSCAHFRDLPLLERDGIRLNHRRALDSCLSMIFSENRFTLFRIML